MNGMEVSSLIHQSDSLNSFPLSMNEVEIRLLTKKDDDILKVELVYNEKYKFAKGVHYLEMKKVMDDGVHDFYVVRLRVKDKRLAYVFLITLLDGKKYYFSESGIHDSYDIAHAQFDFFQVSFINKVDLVNIHPVLANRNFYQIFVDRFYKDETNDNPRINIKWGDKVSVNSLAGGTLRGIDEKLDYISSLGVNALYLTPISEADTNHKYDTIDYFEVAKDFGDEIDLKNLVEHAHKRNMIILLDGVYNHVSTSFFAFQDVKKNGRKSRYFDWFYINGDELRDDNYETFGLAKFLPRLNLNNIEVQNYLIEVGVHYVKNFNIDGYRLDVSDEIPHAFWIKFSLALEEVNKDIILLGENWHDAHAYLNDGFKFDSIMNYAFTRDVLDFVAYQKIDVNTFKNRLVMNYFRYKTPVNYNLLNLLSSHDVPRFLSECDGNIDRFLIGYALLYMQIGVPCLYYGDEIGMLGENDPDDRRCFEWDKTKWNVKINETIKKLIRVHYLNNLYLMNVRYEVDGEIFKLVRYDDKNCVTLFVNLSSKQKTYTNIGEVVLSNNYENGSLLPDGFFISVQ